MPRSALRRLIWAVPVAVAALAAVVLVAIWLRQLPPVAGFIADYPGTTELPSTAPTGIPAWVGWQHFLNAFFMVLIVRTGWQVRTIRRPPAYWTRRPGGTRISLHLWLHLALDILWVANGLVFIVLILATGHWMRLVPLSLDVIPQSVSVALQYASLDWPADNGWIHYNALQLISYFITVFIAAPLAIVSGVRMSPFWPRTAPRLNRVYPIGVARAVHFPVMLWFVAFTIVHVTLVFATGAVRNLDHMYAARDDSSWLGFAIFAASLVVTVVAWVLAKPSIVRSIAALTGTVTR